LNYILIILTFIIFIGSLLYYRYSLKQKNKIIEREISLNTERMRSIEEKRMLQEKQQKELLNVVINAQEEERRKIAIDIHDGLGQLLTGVKLNIQLALAEKNISSETEEIIKNIQSLNNESIAESKNMASNLLPYNIKDFGLVAAIKNLCYNNNQLKVSDIKFYSNDVPRKLPSELEIAVYRITQELVSNALKHAKAKEIFVQLFYRESKLVLQVEDDGVGFDKNQSNNQNGMGLKNITIRAQLLFANLEIDSVLNKGTTTLIEFPLLT
jgi:two-component system NarL family sensor kinase